MKKLLLFLILSLPNSSFAIWSDLTKADPITNIVTKQSYSYSDGGDNQIGLRCDTKGNDTDLYITFSVKKAIATPRTSVDFYIKTDSNEPIKFDANLYSNSYDSGYVNVSDSNKEKVMEMIQQMKTGKTSFVRVESSSELIDYYIDLSGFTSVNTPLLKTCKFDYKRTEISAVDSARLKEIDEKIGKLNIEKKQILSKY